MNHTNLKDIDLYELIGILSTATTQEVSEKRITEQDNSNLVTISRSINVTLVFR